MILGRHGLRVLGKACAILTVFGGVSGLFSVESVRMVFASTAALFCGVFLAIFEFSDVIADKVSPRTAQHVNHFIHDFALESSWRRGGVSFAAALALANGVDMSFLPVITIALLVAQSLLLIFFPIDAPPSASQIRPSILGYQKVDSAAQKLVDDEVGVAESKDGVEMEAFGTPPRPERGPHSPHTFTI